MFSVRGVPQNGVVRLCVQVLVAERGPLVFVFNWHPHDDYEGLKIAAPQPGRDQYCCAVANMAHVCCTSMQWAAVVAAQDHAMQCIAATRPH